MRQLSIAHATGGRVLLAPTIELLRHPPWRPAQETYGEDALHPGRMGVGFIRGARRREIPSGKLYAASSIEDTRFAVNVTLDERTLREVYLLRNCQLIGGEDGTLRALDEINAACQLQILTGRRPSLRGGSRGGRVAFPRRLRR